MKGWRRPQAGTEIVGNLAHDRVENGVEHERDGEHQPDHLRRQADDLIVEQHQQSG
jgi:hypothetical protein